MSLTKKVLSGFAFSMVLGTVAPLVVANAATFANGYTYRRAITVSSTLLAPSGTSLSNFPILFSGNYSYLEASSTLGASGTLQSDKGYDIIFTSDAAGNSPLSYERESYTSSTGAVNFWIKVPALSSSSNTIYMFYDGTTTVDQSSSTNTWSSNYISVYHLPNGTTLTGNDSASGYNASTSLATAGPGEIYGGAKLNGTSAYLTIPQGGHFGLSTSTFSLDTWLKDDTTAANLGTTFHRIISWDTAGHNIQLGLGQDSTGAKRTFYLMNATGNANPVVTATGTAPTGFNHVVVTYNGSSTYHIYVNGVQSDGGSLKSGVITGFFGNTNTIYLGQRGDSQGFASGTLDEVRISNAVLSPDWIKTEYNTANNANFYAVGAATTGSSLSAPVINSTSTLGCVSDVACSYQIGTTATSSPTSYNATGLPPGLTVNTSTGAISGFSEGSNFYSVTLSATNSAGTGTSTLRLQMWTTANFPSDGVDPIIASEIPFSAQNIDQPGAGVSFSGITTTSTPSGTIIYSAPNQWADYTINVPYFGQQGYLNYVVVAKTASLSTTSTLEFLIDGTAVSTVSVPYTGSLTTQTSTISVPFGMLSGIHTLQVLSPTGNVDLSQMFFDMQATFQGNSIFTIGAPLPGNPNACAYGVACSVQFLTATGTLPLTYSEGGSYSQLGQVGLALDSSSGYVSGTVSSTLPYTYTYIDEPFGVSNFVGNDRILSGRFGLWPTLEFPYGGYQGFTTTAGSNFAYGGEVDQSSSIGYYSPGLVRPSYLTSDGSQRDGGSLDLSSSSYWGRYTVNVSSTGTYSFTVHTEGTNPSSTLDFQVTPEPTLPTSTNFAFTDLTPGGVAINNANSNTVAVTSTVTGISLTQGLNIIRVSSPSGGVKLTDITF